MSEKVMGALRGDDPSVQLLRVDFVGVAMQSGNEPAFNRPEVLALDDWR